MQNDNDAGFVNTQCKYEEVFVVWWRQTKAKKLSKTKTFIWIRP